MRKWLLCLSALLLSITSFAQITITSCGFKSASAIIHTSDSLGVINVGASSFPGFAASDTGKWDLGSVMYDSAITKVYHVSPDTSVAEYADSSFSALGPAIYQSNTQVAITASGIVNYGINITGTALALGGADSLIIPTQHSVYSTPDTILKLPTTDSTSWTNHYVDTFHFVINFPPFYTYGSGRVKAFFTSTNKVIGYGMMRVKTATGAVSGYMSVLQIATTTIQTDSFYINDSVPNPLVLSFFAPYGLTEGKADTTISQSYYRTGEFIPLAQFTFAKGDTGYTKPTAGQVHLERLAPNAVANVSHPANFIVYPNPVSNRTLTLVLPEQRTGWSYEIVNLLGQKIAGSTIDGAATASTLLLPENITPGLYYIKLYDGGQLVGVKPVTVAE
jgi:hypothetical protein